tara:strand:+ start:317 stop:577 length:261 start_codon:yes stop_codon:yes gene_type:complete
MIKWLIVVIFANTSPIGDRELYVFIEPTYEEQHQCLADITDPAVYPGLARKVLEAYDFNFKPIERVVCVPEEKVLEWQVKEKGIAL